MKVQNAQNISTAQPFSGSHSDCQKSAGDRLRSSVRCRSTNGAHASRVNISNTAIVGPASEDLHERASFAQSVIPVVEKILGTDSHESSDETGEAFSSIEEAVEAIKVGKVRKFSFRLLNAPI